MFALNLLSNYHTMRMIGLVRSKRDFARRWLGRGPTFIRDLEFRGRLHRPVSAHTAARLRGNLAAVAEMVPLAVSSEIRDIIATLDRDAWVARTFAAWSR